MMKNKYFFSLLYFKRIKNKKGWKNANLLGISVKDEWAAQHILLKPVSMVAPNLLSVRSDPAIKPGSDRIRIRKTGLVLNNIVRILV